jgi:hypothetical protein
MATKMSEVHVGDTWIAKVSGNLCRVRIARDRGYRISSRRIHLYDRCGQSGDRHNGWDATNLETGKTVHIKGSQRLRKKVLIERGDR